MEEVKKTVKEFYVESCEYFKGGVPVLHKLPTFDDFIRDYAVANKPFILKKPYPDQKNFVLNSWNEDSYLCEKMRGRKVTVAVTPPDKEIDDLKLCDYEKTNVYLPEERQMSFYEFFYEFNRMNRKGNFNIEKQNNMNNECVPLFDDVKRDIPLVTEMLRGPPSSVNLKIGNRQNPTFLRNYPNEIIIFGISGDRTFSLYPPNCTTWLPYRKYKKFQWHWQSDKKSIYGTPDSEVWKKIDLNEEVKCIDLTKQPETLEKFKIFTSYNMEAYKAVVGAGEFLYISALWFYESYEGDRTISVEYFYEMKRNVKLPYFRLLDKVKDFPIRGQNASTDVQPEFLTSLIIEARDRMAKRNKRKGRGLPKV